MRIYIASLLISLFIPLTVFAQPFAYVMNNSSNDVSVINVASRQVVATVNVGNGPASAASTVDGQYVYVTNSDSNNVSVIEVSTNTVIDTISVGSDPIGIAASPDGMFVYVTNRGSNNVSIIETTTNTVVETIAVIQDPEGVAFSNDSVFAYVVNISDSVSVINAASMEVVNTIQNVGNLPIEIAVNPDVNNAFAYVSDINSDALTEIDLTSETVSDTISLVTNNNSGDAGDLVFTSDGSTIYVQFAGGITIVDIATKMATSTIGVGGDCLGITPDDESLYVCVTVFNGPNIDYFVRVIDLSTNTVVDSIPVGMSPSGVAFTPSSGVGAPDPESVSGGNGSCALSDSGNTTVSFPLFLLIPAFILAARVIRRKSEN